MPYRRLSRSMMLSLIPILTLVMILIFFVIKIEDERVLKELEASSALLSSKVINVISSELSGPLEDVRFLAGKPFIQKIASGREISEEEVLRLKSYLLHHPHYSQLRIIDDAGMELFRINSDDGEFTVVAKEHLQNKANRYYVKDALIATFNDEVYVSRFDLNVEQNQIEIPYKPTLRIMSPLGDDNAGMVILNLDGDHLLGLVEQIANKSAHKDSMEIAIVNNQGFYFTDGFDGALAWGAIIDERAEHNIKTRQPELWDKVTSGDSFFTLDKSAYFMTSVCDSLSCTKLDADDKLTLHIQGYDFPWTIIIKTAIDEYSDSAVRSWMLLYGLALVLGAIIVVLLYYTLLIIKAKRELEIAENDLSDVQSIVDGVFEHSPSMMIIMTPNGLITRANEAFSVFLNTPMSSVIGKHFNQLVQSKLMNHLEDETEFTEEQWLNSLNQLREIYAIRFKLHDKAHTGEFFTVVLATDVSELVEAKREGQEKNTYLSAIINSTPDSVLIVNSDGHIIFTNDQVSSTFGWSAEELRGLKVEQLVPSDKRHHHVSLRDTFNLNPERKVMAEKLSADVIHSVKGLRKDGSQFDVEITLCPVVIASELSTVCLVRDISQKLAFENQVRQSQRIEAVGTLSGGIAHDFNNLLGVIIGNLELLSHEVDPGSKHRLKSALLAAEKGAEMTKRLLAFSRKQNLEPRVICVHEVIESIKPLIENIFKDMPEVTIDYKCLRDRALAVEVDQTEFENVILNMAFNARDAIGKDGHFSIHVTHTKVSEQVGIVELNGMPEDREFVQINIIDNGVGIPKEAQERIFEPFYTSKQESGKGNGLGLAMAHGFIKQSNGFIKVYSEVGIGTEFKILLPAVDTNRIDQIDNKSEPAQNYDLAKLCFAIVDDNLEMAEIVKSHLLALGATNIHLFDSSTSFIRAFSDLDTIDIVITDIVMPNSMSGIELADFIQEAAPETEFIFTSGFSNEALKLNASRKNLKYFLQKPFKQAALERVVQAILSAQK